MNTLALHPTPDLDSIIERMDARLLLFARSEDQRERFLLMYRTFKIELRRNVQVGRFLDAAWTEAICCRMAEMYFEADTAYSKRRQDCPEPWTYCFDAATAGRTNLLQDMLLGMNAHINYDLPLCTYDTFIKFDDLAGADAESDHADLMFDTTLKRRYLDFLMINQIAWESITLIQDVALGRFARLLNVANILSLRFTKYIGETIIVDYRDRAWAHTLLLATVRDRDEVTTINRLTTRFAMEAASLVARLTLSPIQFVQALRRQPRHLADDTSEVVHLLVDRLKSRPTARVARRALIEYGASIHPILEQILDNNPGDTRLQIELFKIMARHPTPATARALFKRLNPADPRSYNQAILQLASMRMAGARFILEEHRVQTLIEQERVNATEYFDDYYALGEHGRGMLLDEALRIRIANILRRILYLSSFLTTDHDLLAAVATISSGDQIPPPDTMLARLQNALAPEHYARTFAILEASRPTLPEQEVLSDAQQQHSIADCLAHLVRTDDPWLQTCAVHRIGEMDLVRLLPMVLEALNASTALVKETALYAARVLIPASDFRTTLSSAIDARSDPWLASLIQENDMLSTIEKVLYLKNCELFRDIPSEDLAQIAGLARRYRFTASERLIEEGKPGEALYVILDGEINVVAGEEHHLAHVGHNAVLGEMSLLSELPCSATCVALHAGHALRIGRADFLQFLLDYPEIAMALIQVLIQRLRDANLRLQQQTQDSTGEHLVLPGTWSP